MNKDGTRLLTPRVSKNYSVNAAVTLYEGDRLGLLSQIPAGEARLVVTSPPYNIGKKYERRLGFEHYLEQQRATLRECYRILADDGSLCWQVGNHVATDGEIFPLDIYIYEICKKLGLKLRNRIVWCFEHGLHCKQPACCRCETILSLAGHETCAFYANATLFPQKDQPKGCLKGPEGLSTLTTPLGRSPAGCAQT